MSKTSKSHQANRSSNELKAIKKLASLADLTFSSDAKKEDQIKLTGLVYHHLKQGHDDILLQAVERIEAEEIAGYLKSLIIDCSETEGVQTDTGELGEAMLFAVPVVMTMELDVNIPQKLTDATTACRLFRQHGLISKDPSLLLHGDFLSSDDVSLTPCQRYKLLNQFMRTLRGTAEFPKIRKALDQSNLSLDEGDLMLFYLVGSVVSRYDDLPFAPFDDEGESMDRYSESLAAWQEAFASELSRQTGISNIAIGEPVAFDEAIKQGVELCACLDLSLVANRAVEWAAEEGSICRAVASCHTDENEEFFEIHIGFFDRLNNPLEMVRYNMFNGEEPLFSPEAIELIFNEAGVADLTLIEDILPTRDAMNDSKSYFPSPPEQSVFIRDPNVTLH